MGYLIVPGGAGGGGGATPKAATVVVASSGGDATTIAGGIALLPAAGGYLYLREGTYSISSSIVLPSTKDVKIIGSGIGNTTISLGANAINAFSLVPSAGFNPDVEISDLTVTGTSVANQRLINVDGTLAAAFLRLIRVKTVNMDRHIRSQVGNSIENLWVEECFLQGGAGPNNTLYEGTGGGTIWHMSDTVIKGLRVLDRPDFTFWENVLWDEFTGPSLFAESSFSNVSFIGGADVELGLRGKCALVNCNLEEAHINFTDDAEAKVTGCQFDTSGARNIDIIGTDPRATIENNHFLIFGSAAIRIASTRNIVSGNIQPKTLEIGAANLNIYTSNNIFTGSTIIGAGSIQANNIA